MGMPRVEMPFSGNRWLVGTIGAAAAICTFVVLLVAPSTVWAACPNEAFRTGPSAQLADCRAYEQVTPTAAGQLFGDIYRVLSFDQFPSELASSLQDSVVFSTEGYGLIDPPGGGGTLGRDVWQAQRTSAGWEITHHVTPAADEAIEPIPGGVSADHTFSFVFAGPESGTKTPGHLGSLYGDHGSDYIGDMTGHFELTGCGSLGCEREVQGRFISPGGEHIIFSNGKSTAADEWCQKIPCKAKQLEPEAPPTGTGAIYDRQGIDGPTRVISLLPGNTQAAAGEEAVYQGASADGSTVTFRIKGILYARVGNEKTEVITAAAATYAGSSADGRYVFYVSGEDIHRFDTEDESDDQVTSSGDAKMMNASEDGSHVYFISPSQLDGSEGTAGEPNMYLWNGTSIEYITTVEQSDLEGQPGLGIWALAQTNGLGVEASRVTPDGRTVVFESAAPLPLEPSYDNNGQTELYRRVEGQAVECVSCNPSEAPAVSGARLQNQFVLGYKIILNNLSADGSRVFFETQEALVEGDTDNGINDSYEWQAPAGLGGDPELSLISSGRSLDYPFEEGQEQNSLFAITKSGSDVFFKSQDALVPGAPTGGTPVIYDARTGGGFPEPESQPVCVEEGCRGPLTAPPLLGTAGSASLQGSGNAAPPRRKRRRHHRHCKHHGKPRACPKRQAASASSLAGSGSTAGVAFPEAPPQDLSLGTSAPSSAGAAGTSPTTSASGSEFSFGIESAKGEVSTAAAARHPDLTSAFSLTAAPGLYAAKMKDAAIELPPGLYGNPNLIPRCSTGQFLAKACPIDSQVGVSRVVYKKAIGTGGFISPLYNLAPPHPGREIARLGFIVIQGLSVFVDVSVRTAGDYGITASAQSAPSLYPLLESETIVWGNPADPSHNNLRMTPREATSCVDHTACEAPGGERSPEELGPIAFMTNPSACGPWSMGFELTSYQLPGPSFSGETPMQPGPVSQCEGIPFAPSLEARPTTDVAGAPTGLSSSVKLPQGSDPSAPSTATMREARVTLPEGMTINPGAADGLAACSDQQVHLHEEVDAACPDASKIGSLKIVSPALEKPLQGAVYQRSSGGKGNLFRLWLVTDEFGLHVKIPGEVKPDPNTGQLTAVFADLPQVPVEQIDLDVWGGARAPLKNPDTCGTYNTTSVLKPWSSDPPASPSDSFSIDRSSGGGPCPSTPTQEPNTPDLEAGTTSPIAATYSPFVLKLQREDGTQPFGALSLTLPPGLVGKLAGLSACSEAALASAATKSGAAEQADPSCPPASLIGTVHAAAGAGPAPFWTQGQAYLAGPYKGAPLSVAIITPAVAGPFDLGTVVVRSAVQIDPESAQITVKTDPLPQILEGVPLNLRNVAVEVDRPQFMRNGTSCDPLAFNGELVSSLGAHLPLSERFQLAECGRLSFKPKIALQLKGSVRRTANPKLIATVTGQPEGAGVARAQVKLPPSAFLDNSHIGQVCTRVQFAAHSCPARSIYGRATVRTPIVDYPVSGPVLLRSSSHPLPDLVIDLHGPESQPIEVALVGRTDAVKGALRNTFEATPDLPFTSLRVELFGGKRGLIEMSSGFCRHPKATVSFTAHNGASYNSRPLVGSSCGAKGEHKHHG
jgi:hypothetical protein